MPKNPVFDQARGRATPELVESLFASSAAYWDGAEYWTLNPLRGDGAVGSFSINGHTGLWSDFASGDKGDLVKLIHDTGKASSLVKAAEMVVAAIGGTVEQSDNGTPAKSHLDKAKPKAILSIPEDKLDLLKPRINGDWAREHHGAAVKGWVWRDPEGRAWCSTVRFERTDETGKVSKDVIAHYWAEDGKWHEGNPMPTARHLFRVDQIVKADAGTPILIVEGEKKAAVKVPGYLLTTWIGGAKAWNKTEWAPLERFASAGLVTIWPDADAQTDKNGKLLPWEDQPGMVAGIAIMKRLPGAKLLDVRDRAAIKSGWDLADAVDEGVDPVEFIASCPILGSGPPPDDGATALDPNMPFLPLGYDKSAYYFLRKANRTIFSIAMGSWNSSKLGELAPLSWWSIMGHVTDQGSIKVSTAQNDVAEIQHKVGFFDPKKVRGAGVWRDRQGIILNDGRRIVTMDGKSYSYDEYASGFYYVPSQVAFGEMHGPESTPEDGRQLEELFRSLEFEESSQAVLLMGWCLIAPFGGVLAWRPHVWLTGQAGTGKSWAIENILLPLLGPFALVGSAKDTEAGIRWKLDNDARPGAMLEMEGKSEASRKKIQSIVDLVRNFSDNSGMINISQAGGGTKSFDLRSMFLMSSKVAPQDDDSVSSRFSVLQLRKPRTTTDEERKINACLQLVGDIMDDPGRFMRRTFRALPQIIADIEYLRSAYLSVFRRRRAIDQVAPLLAAAWAAQSDKSIRTAGGWLERLVIDLAQETKATVGDEDVFMSTLVARGLKTDDNKTRTIAELLLRVADPAEGEDGGSALNLLERYGITMRRRALVKPWTLFIATESAELAALFRDTAWGDAYGAQVRRCPCVIDGTTRPVTLRSGRKRCQALDWEAFRLRYLGPKDEEPGLVFEEEEDGEVPF